MNTPAQKLRDILDRFGETAIMAGVIIEIRDGKFVIESESGATVTLAADVEEKDLICRFLDIVEEQAVEYRGYTITPKLDFGNRPHLVNGAYYKHGWVVVKDGCNAMPGATWFSLVSKAKRAIDILEDVGEDSDEFWKRMRAA
jgi:hypothetical protein